MQISLVHDIEALFVLFLFFLVVVVLVPRSLFLFFSLSLSISFFLSLSLSLSLSLYIYIYISLSLSSSFTSFSSASCFLSTLSFFSRSDSPTSSLSFTLSSCLSLCFPLLPFSLSVHIYIIFFCYGNLEACTIQNSWQYLVAGAAKT